MVSKILRSLVDVLSVSHALGDQNDPLTMGCFGPLVQFDGESSHRLGTAALPTGRVLLVVLPVILHLKRRLYYRSASPGTLG